MNHRAAIAVAVGWLAEAACSRSGKPSGQADSLELARRDAHLATVIAAPDSELDREAAVAKWTLGANLAEISGLVLTTDGRLLTHGDEKGRVFEVDYRRGQIVKEFRLGKDLVRADFEGIANVNDTLFLLTSKGTLYQFQEGKAGHHVKYTIRKTGLESQCEFEGVAFDPLIHSLLLACKTVRTKGPLRDSLVIYRWKVAATGDPAPSRLTVPMAQLIGGHDWKTLHPSDITVDPLSGNYLIVAGPERALIEITPTGTLVFARPLPAGLAHAEGVAITKDSLLIVSTEARDGTPAAITLFRWP